MIIIEILKSWYVQNGSFCKIKTVQIGYTFPKKIVEATKVFSSLRLYVSGENLFTFTKFKYMDPGSPKWQCFEYGYREFGVS